MTNSPNTRKTLTVSQATYEAAHARRELLEATRGIPTTIGDVVADALEEARWGAHRASTNLLGVLNAVIPEIAGGEPVSFRGVTIDPEAQQVVVRFWDRDPITVPASLPRPVVERPE